MEEKKDEILELDADQLEELLNNSDMDKLPPIEIDFQDYNVKEFQRGIHETSYVCGQITALFNAGLSESSVLDYLLSTQTIKHNIDVAKINKEMNVEMSKNQKAAQEKFEL